MSGIPQQIPDEELQLSDIPDRDADFNELSRFALTLDGPRAVTRIAELANRSAERWKERGELPAELHELRECLFFEQRRQRHFGSGPGGAEHPRPEAVSYMRALVDAIRRSIAER